MSVTIEVPNRPRTRKQANWEKYGWLFMRVSGPLLIVLIFTHLVVNLVLGDGIKAIDFAFVAGKWADPFWQVWDLAMLWLALLAMLLCLFPSASAADPGVSTLIAPSRLPLGTSGRFIIDNSGARVKLACVNW